MIGDFAARSVSNLEKKSPMINKFSDYGLRPASIVSFHSLLPREGLGVYFLDLGGEVFRGA